MSQEVSRIGFLLPVSHVCLQIAFPVSHIGFTISPNFNYEMKLKVDLWLDYSYFVFGMSQYHFFP